MNKELEEKLALISAKYGKELPAQLAKISELWSALLHNWSDKTFAEFRENIHTLSGSAGMFGFDHVGDIAKQIQLIYHSAKSREVLSDNEKNEITKLIQTLMQCM